MNLIKNKLFIFLLAIIAAAFVVFYASRDHIFLYMFRKNNNLEISYGSLKKIQPDTLKFTGLEIIDKKSGIGILSKDAAMKPAWSIFDQKNATIEFSFKDVNFISRKEAKGPAYDSLTGLVNVPLESQWTYKELSGRIRQFADGIDIEGLKASGDEINLSFSGTIRNDDTVKLDIVIYFAAKVTDKIPEAFSKTILRDEPDGWKSLAVNLTGNFKSPSIQVTGKLFRLNIRAIEHTTGDKELHLTGLS